MGIALFIFINGKPCINWGRKACIKTKPLYALCIALFNGFEHIEPSVQDIKSNYLISRGIKMLISHFLTLRIKKKVFSVFFTCNTLTFEYVWMEENGGKRVMMGWHFLCLDFKKRGEGNAKKKSLAFYTEQILSMLTIFERKTQ